MFFSKMKKTDVYLLLKLYSIVERCGAVVKHRTRDREVPGSIPTQVLFP